MPFRQTVVVGGRELLPTKSEHGERPVRMLRGEMARATNPFPTGLSQSPRDDHGQASPPTATDREWDGHRWAGVKSPGSKARPRAHPTVQKKLKTIDEAY